MGRLLHTIGRVCQSAHEQSKPGSAVAVPTASSRDGLGEERGQAAAYHWPGLSAHERSKPGSAVAALKRLPVMVLEKSVAGCCIPLAGSVSARTKQACFSGCGPTTSSRDGLSAFPCWQPGNHTTPIPPPFMSAMICVPGTGNSSCLPVMVLEKSVGRLLHTIGRVCQAAYEQSKPGSTVAVLKRLPVMVFQLFPADNPVITRPRFPTFHVRHNLRPQAPGIHPAFP